MEEHAPADGSDLAAAEHACGGPGRHLLRDRLRVVVGDGDDGVAHDLPGPVPRHVPAAVAVLQRDPAPLDGLWRTQLAFADAEDAAQLHEIEVREIAVGPQGELVAGGPSAVECYSADLGRLESFAGVQSIDYAEALALVPWTVILPPGVLGATSRLDTGDVPLGDIPKFDDEDAEETDTQLPNPKGGG